MRSLTSAANLALSCLLACGSAAETETRSETDRTQAASDTTDTAVEGCARESGCDPPIELKGTKKEGEACSEGIECSPALCSCGHLNRRPWYAASCRNRACASEEDACGPLRGVYCR